MRFMEGDKPFGQISGEVPQDLIDAFDACINRLGITKKRAIATDERYYGMSDPNDRTITGSASEVGKRAGAAVARGGSKRRPTTGKSSA